MIIIAGLLLFCALCGLCGPRGVALAVVVLGSVFAAAVAAHLTRGVAF
jgi:hypothetical protein